MIRRYRKLTHIAVFVFLVFVPLMSYAAVLYQVFGKGGYHIAELSGTFFENKLYQAYAALLSGFSEPVILTDSIKGSFWSFTIFGYKVSDPLAFLGHLLASGTLFMPLLASILLPVILALILGRVFCGWLCPMNAILELVDDLRGWFQKYFYFSLFSISFKGRNKYIVLAAGLLLAPLTGISIFPLLLPYVAIGREFFSLVFYGATTTIGLLLITAIILFDFMISRRGWCRYFCPGGAMLSILSFRPLLKVERNSGSACNDGCNQCGERCPMALSPGSNITGPECMKCGECISTCPRGILRFRFTSRPAAALPLVLFFILLSTLLSYGSSAHAHHIRGFPHYGYAENYPQIPTAQYGGATGDWDATMVAFFFDGAEELRMSSDTPNDVQFFIHILNMKTNQSYMGRMNFAVKEDGDTLVGQLEGITPLEESAYRVRQTFPRVSGNYTISLRIFPEDASGPVVINVPFEFLRKGPNYRLISVGAGIILCLIGMALYHKKKAISQQTSG